MYLYRDAYLCKLGLKGIPLSDDGDSENDSEKTKESRPEGVDSDSEEELDEEQKLMKSMGLPVSFTTDMRIADSDEETQVQSACYRSCIFDL